MNKKTLIIIIVCVLVAVVIGLSVSGVIGPQGSAPTATFAGWQESCRGIPSMP